MKKSNVRRIKNWKPKPGKVGPSSRLQKEERAAERQAKQQKVVEKGNRTMKSQCPVWDLLDRDRIGTIVQKHEVEQNRHTISAGRINLFMIQEGEEIMVYGQLRSKIIELWDAWIKKYAKVFIEDPMTTNYGLNPTPTPTPDLTEGGQ